MRCITKKIIIVILFLLGAGLSAQWTDSSRIWVNDRGTRTGLIDKFIDELDTVLANNSHKREMLFTDHLIGYNGRWGDLIIDLFGVSDSNTTALCAEIYFVNDMGRWIYLYKTIALFRWNQKDMTLDSLNRVISEKINEFEKNSWEAVYGAH